MENCPNNRTWQETALTEHEIHKIQLYPHIALVKLVCHNHLQTSINQNAIHGTCISIHQTF